MKRPSLLVSPLMIRVWAGLFLALLAAFYLYVLNLAANPQVGAAYRLFYFEQALSDWPGDTLSALPTTPLELRTDADPRIGAGFEAGGREEGLWTIANDAYLILPAPAPQDSDSYWLEVEVSRVFISAVHDTQPVTLFVNGHRLADWRLLTAEGVTLTVVIPARVIGEDGLAVIHLDLPNAHSPAQAGLGADGRPLALFIRSARLLARQPA
ncbi:hypothetical protein [Aquisalinus flavus]|uniref:Uncharacterized protein n=1 Tax=Aquisalinus flavus TaxID=1526572 RepID=A0A8J2V669_9PROT|nr:hypothetical protein [Aquisalinus flavus]MBD0426239.1 hypothetical protein [Aquisalinus flavus]UNE48189.1 hypothetical protein FF099_09060 [Aquisalinus flavus]GGD09515.1 hypothetical protein GCM10011342_17980 [Aquisalinus flavus]